jgi:imidazolonepropionase-like amidohydrolase
MVSAGNTQIPIATGNRRVWLRVRTLLDGISSIPMRGAHVVYDESELLFASASSSPPAELLRPEQRQPDADLPDYTLLPGLIEAHAHLFLAGGELNPQRRAAQLKQTPVQLLKNALPRLEPLVKFGIIAVRDAGDKDGVGLALRRRYAEGNGHLMPYVDSPGAAIHRRGRYGSFMAGPIEDHPSLRACVESRVHAGADRIKLIPTGIINFKQGAVTSEPQMTTPEVRELVSAAQAYGKQTLAHASGAAGIEHVIEGGVDSVEHGYFIREDQLARMRDRQIAWVPTFAPLQAQVEHADVLGWDGTVVDKLKAILDQHAASLVKAHAMGVQIIAGSDAGSFGVGHGMGLLSELELMERAGLAPQVVINSATGAGSQRLAFPEKFGVIKPGYRSRFLLTRHSPLEGIANLKKEKLVVFNGRVLHAGKVDPTGL